MQNKKGKILNFLFIFSLVLTIPIIVILILKNTELRKKASDSIFVCFNGGTGCDYDYQNGLNRSVIQQAVDGAPNGSTIIFEGGEEEKEYLINEGSIAIRGKDIEIRGEESKKVVFRAIDTGYYSYIFIIKDSSFFKMNNLIFRSDSHILKPMHLFEIERVDNIEINNSYFHAGEMGIIIRDSAAIKITNNYFNPTFYTNIVIQGIMEVTSDIIISNNVFFHKNEGNGVISCNQSNANIKIINNTFDGYNKNAIFAGGGNSLTVINNIFTNGGSEDSPAIDISEVYTTVNCSNNLLWGNASNFGGFAQSYCDNSTNINSDPMFEDRELGKFLLNFDSPAIDKGVEDIDQDGNTWIDDSDDQDVHDANNNVILPAKGSLRSDIGAFGGPYAKYIEVLALAQTKKESITICNKEEFGSTGDCNDIEQRYQWSSLENPNAFINAIADIKDNGEIFIKKGHYEVRPYDIMVNSININIKGEGKGKTILSAAFQDENHGIVELDSISITLKDITLEGAPGYAIMDDQSASIVIDNIEMINNECGISYYWTASSLVKNSLLKGTGADSNCSAIKIKGGSSFPGAKLELRNNVIANWRNAISSIEGNIEYKIFNNTFANFSTSAIWVHSTSGAYISNNIITGVQTTGFQVFAIDSGVLKQCNYNLLYNNVDNYSDYAQSMCKNDITGKDPLFVNEGTFDYHLQEGSPAIDAGDPEKCDFNGSRSDIGAYGGNGTCGVDGQISIGFNIKLEKKLVNSAPEYSNSKVRVLIKNSETVYADYVTSSDRNGSISPTSFSDIQPGTYDIFIKPYGYISQKQTFSIEQGENIIDFRNLEFRAGDNNELSYDFLNSLDFSLFIMHFREDNKSSDYNLDNTINSLDFSIMLKTFRENRVGELSK